MADSSDTNDLLRALLTTVGRTAFKPHEVYDVVAPNAKSGKQIAAFNLADGTRTQGQIAKAAKLDAGNFSRTAARWVEAGVLFRIGNGGDSRLLHIYPIPSKRPQEPTNE